MYREIDDPWKRWGGDLTRYVVVTLTSRARIIIECASLSVRPGGVWCTVRALGVGGSRCAATFRDRPVFGAILFVCSVLVPRCVQQALVIGRPVGSGRVYHYVEGVGVGAWLEEAYRNCCC